MLDADREQVRAGELAPGDRLALAEAMPERQHWTAVAPELSKLLGYLAADGYVQRDGSHMRFVNGDAALRLDVAQLWSKCFTGTVNERTTRSGFDAEREVPYLELCGAPSAAAWLREQLYTRTGLKQVPPVVLNGTAEVHEAFLAGYYAGDGLKRGNGDSIKTNSPVLAQGVLWLYALAGRPASVYAEQRGDRTYYQLNLRTAVPVGARGAHLARDPAEVREIEDGAVGDDEWVFDLETESGVFCAGVGRVVVHNSPRRGETFVTRKITRALARIQAGLQDKLYLGNLDAKRDWGFAGDYTDAMWRMLQADEPEDFVIATGQMHSVREFLDEAAAHLGVDWEKHVEFDPRYLRPAEVDALQGDPTKAREKLGWTPTVDFKGLVRMMVDADVKQLEDELAGRAVRM
jgi:GDPmannose 4,6-dehydratase